MNDMRMTDADSCGAALFREQNEHYHARLHGT
jgi:hypothetical protein